MDNLNPAEVFKAESLPVASLLGYTARYLYIPAYQRPYEWGEIQVKDLMVDIADGVRKLHTDDRTVTFYGSVILVHDQKFESVNPLKKQDMPEIISLVIDGQQRMTTLQLLCLVLHNKIRIAIEDQKKHAANRSQLSETDGWLINHANATISDLQDTLYTEEPLYNAERPKYLRIIRASLDCYAKREQDQIYSSPLASTVNLYIKSIADSKDFEIPKNVTDKHHSKLLERLSEIFGYVDLFIDGKNLDEDEFLLFGDSIHSKSLFKGLGLSADEETFEKIQKLKIDDPIFVSLFRLIVIARYVLRRTIVTKITCTDEDYAFSVFESLNSTGTPLTALETFIPQIVRIIGLREYEGSDIQSSFDFISRILASKTPEEMYSATNSLLTTYALAESGAKLPAHLSEQRKYMNNLLSECKTDKDEIAKTVQSLKVVGEMRNAFAIGKGPELPQVTVHEKSELDLVFGFLNKHNHQIPLGILARFYSKLFDPDPTGKNDRINQQSFITASKACLAFTVLWRASRTSTQGIDSKYRELMINRQIDGVLQTGFARKYDGDCDVANLKTEFKRLLAQGHGHKNRVGLITNGINKVTSKDDFIRAARTLNIYTENRALSRMVLLAAHHQTTSLNQKPKQIVKGKEGCESYLTFEKWNDASFSTIEHIAPQGRSTGADWDSSIYENSLTDRIGNLTLLSRQINSLFGNRSWKEKKVLYSALSKKTKEEAEKVFLDAANFGVNFAESTEDLLTNWKHIPCVDHIAEQTDFSAESIYFRTDMLLGLAWDELWPWLN